MATAIYRPDSIPGPEPARLAPSPKSLAGLRIAVLDNGKPNAGVVMARVAETLATRVGAKVTLVTKKGPRGESANAAEPCAPDIFERVLKEADLVITGAADCGSCTAYSIVDAIALEKAGIPAVVVTTTKFRPIAETLSEQFGLKETRLLVLPHPIGGTERERLFAWADEGVERVIRVVTNGILDSAISSNPSQEKIA